MEAADASPFIHLTSGTSAAGNVRNALRRLRRDEQVVTTLDGLSVGPLSDVDDDRASRAAWWSLVEGKEMSESEARALDDADVWSTLRGARCSVVVWHGPHPEDRLLVLRACWFLREEQERPHEVRLPPNMNPNLRPFFGAVGIVGLDVLVAAWPTRRPMTDVAENAKSWEELRSRREPCVRHLEQDRIVELPLSVYDEDLVRECRGDWRSSSLVIAHVIADNTVGTEFLAWRIRELVAAGRLKGRGDRTNLGAPFEIRPIS